MQSMPEPHIDRPDEPILSDTDGDAPKRGQWPGLLAAVLVLVAAAAAGVVATDRDESNRSGGSPDRRAQATTSSQSPQAEPSHAPRRHDTSVAPPAKPAQP
jgi:hypothetical protein